MAEAIDLDPTIPVVVSETLMKRNGDRLSGTSFLKGRTGDRPAGKTYSLLQRAFSAAARGVRPSLDAERGGPHPRGTPRRIRFAIHLLPREAESSAGRTAENNLEIEEMFRSAGFAVVDPATMTLNRQKAIFRTCRGHRRNQRCGFCERAVSPRQAAYDWRADFIQLDVDNDADDGESLRLQIRRLCN